MLCPLKKLVEKLQDQVKELMSRPASQAGSSIPDDEAMGERERASKRGRGERSNEKGICVEGFCNTENIKPSYSLCSNNEP